MLIYAFCKIWERGIVFVSMFLVFIMVMFRAISGSQILQKKSLHFEILLSLLNKFGKTHYWNANQLNQL